MFAGCTSNYKNYGLGIRNHLIEIGENRSEDGAGGVPVRREVEEHDLLALERLVRRDHRARLPQQLLSRERIHHDLGMTGLTFYFDSVIFL